MTIADNPYNPSPSLHSLGTPAFEEGDLLCIRPKYNSPPKNDVGGAFDPESKLFCEFHGLDPDKHVVVIDNGKYKARRSRYSVANEVIKAITARKPKVTAFFCHGFTHYLQLGIRSPNHPYAQYNDKKLFRKFTKALTDSYEAPNLILYACSTGNDPDKGEEDTAPGAGDDSFSDVCRDKMCERGATFCRVMAHTTAGPATVNPFIKFFDGQGSKFGGTGASFLIPPRTPRYWKALRKHLQTDFRFRFPFMTVQEIQAELERLF